jgi:hypothetical protein
MKTAVIERTLLLFLIAICVGLVLLQALPATNLPSRDGGVYSYIGSQIVRGKLPYVDAWESKPPGIFYLNAVAIDLGGRWGIWILEYLFLFVAVWVGYHVMRKWWGDIPALFGTLLSLLSLNIVLFGGNVTEEYSLPFSFLAFYMFSSSLEEQKTEFHDFLIGLTGGLSFLLRPNNIGVQIAIGATILIWGIRQGDYHRTTTRLFWLGTGFVLPFLIFVAYFGSQQTLQPMLDAALFYNFSYTGEHARPFSAIRQGFFFLNVTAVVALIGYVTILFALRKKVGPPEQKPWYTMLLICWPIEILLSSLSGRSYNHYFICWLPVLSLLCAFAFSYHGQRITALLSSRAVLTYSFLIIIFLIGAGPNLKPYGDVIGNLLTGKALPERLDPVSVYIQENTKPDDKVLVWGAQAGINFLSEREAPTAYFLYPLFIPSPVTIPMADRFLLDMKKNPPALIVDASFYATGQEIFYSLEPEMRQRQQNSIQSDSRVFSAHNIDDVFAFVESHYRPEIKIESTQIYRYDP